MKKILLIPIILISLMFGLLAHEGFHILQTKLVRGGDVVDVGIKERAPMFPTLYKKGYYAYVKTKYDTQEKAELHDITQDFSEKLASVVGIGVSIIAFLCLTNFKISKINGGQKCVYY